MFLRFLLFFGFLTIFGCGAGEDITQETSESLPPWTVPVDIGTYYPVGNVGTGDTVLLSNGTRHTLKENEYPVDSGQTKTLTIQMPVFNETGDLLRDLTGSPATRTQAFTIVPEGPPGPPIVYIFEDNRYIHDPNIERPFPLLDHYLMIDRVLDYHLFVYVESQQLEPEIIGGGARSYHFLHIIPRGQYTSARLDCGNYIGYEPFVKASVRILPHTETDEIELPVRVDLDKNYKVPPELDIAPDYRFFLREDHVFQPYRIASPSYIIGESDEIE